MAEPKTYYSSIPITTFHVMRSPGYCEQIQLVGGRLTTTDEAVQKHLDEIVDKPGSTIYSYSPSSESPDVLETRAAVRADAERAHARMVASGLATA